MRRRRRYAGLALVALVTAACSSTAGDDQSALNPVEETGPPGTTDAVPELPETLQDRPIGPPGTGSAPVVPGTTDLGTRRTRTPGFTPGPPSPGVTDEEIKIGFWFLATDAACGAIGIEGQGGCGTDDDDAELDALVEWVNGSGGIAGRKLTPVVFRTNALRSSWAAQAQAACSHFSEDERVFLAVSEGEAGRPFMATCLAEQGIPAIDPAFWPFDNHSYEELFPYLYQPQRARPDRWMRAYIDGLHAQGFFTPGSTIGLLRFDAAPFTRVTENVLKPRLARHGFQLAEEAIIKTPPSVSAYGEMNSELSSAILRFKSRGVDRVIFFATMAEMSLFYFKQAESQDYRPRYGLSSMEFLNLMENGEAPPAQLRNSVGIGWAPDYDLPPERDPGGTARTKLCASIMKDAGLPSNAGRNAKCDTIFFLKDALDRAAALNLGLNPEGLRLATEDLGKSFVPAHTLAGRFGKNRYDAAAAYRFVAYDQDCGCFRYKGKVRAF